MSFDPSIPAANDVLSQSQSDIQNNFSQSNTLQGLDHYNWNDSTAAGAYRGFHKKLTFPEAPTSDPALNANQGIFFPKPDTKDSSTRAQLYFRNITEIQQVTNRFHSISSGYWMFPGGTASNPSLIHMWGIVPAASFTNAAGASFFDVVFPTITSYAYTGPQTAGFPNNLLNIQLTVSYADGVNKVVHIDNSGLVPTKESFRILMTVTNASFADVHWFAIGN